MADHGPSSKAAPKRVTINEALYERLEDAAYFEQARSVTEFVERALTCYLGDRERARGVNYGMCPDRARRSAGYAVVEKLPEQ